MTITFLNNAVDGAVANDITQDTESVIPLIIDNKSITTGNDFEVRNPESGEIVAQCVGATVDDTKEAVAAAQTAFPGWSKTTPYDRRDILTRAADIMASRREELIRYQIEDTGAGRLFSEKTFELGVSFLRDVAGRIPSIEGVVPSVSECGETAMVFKEPYGVILSIVPWYVFVYNPQFGQTDMF